MSVADFSRMLKITNASRSFFVITHTRESVGSPFFSFFLLRPQGRVPPIFLFLVFYLVFGCIHNLNTLPEKK